MDSALSELLSGLGVLEAWFSSLGIASVRDVKWFWRDIHECLCELESWPGVSREDILRMQDIYLTCCARADLEQAVSVRTVVAARSSSSREVCLWRPTIAEHPDKKRARTLIPWRQSSQPVHASLIPSSRPAGDNAMPKKVRELFTLAVNHFLDLEALGVPPFDWSDEAAVASAEALIMSSASRCSPGHLAQVTSCLRRWIRYATEAKVSLANPGPAQLASFLREVSFGGPTAASGVFNSLAWCNKHLGANFVLDHFLTRSFKCHSLGHKSAQAAELQPWELLNLLAVTAELTGVPQVLGAFILSSAVSCILFRHFQRSTVVQVHEGPPPWIQFKCSMGKSRVQGARPAYEWAMPDLALGGFSLCQCLGRYFQDTHPSGAGYLWPALSLCASELWQLSEATSFCDRQMSRQQFLQCFRGFLCRALVPADKAATAGYNRLRRCMPTGGHHLGFSDSEAQAIGSWTEVPGGSGSASRQPAAKPMSRHYAGDKVRTSFLAKHRILEHVLRAFKNGSWPRAEGSNLLKPGCFLWQDLGAAGAQGEALDRPPALSAGSAAHDSSSEASSTDDEDSDASSGVADESAQFDWIQQGAKRHVVREVGFAGRPVPWCRDNSFVQDPAAKGSGVDVTSASAWCTKCFGRMPGPQAKQLRLQLE